MLLERSQARVNAEWDLHPLEQDNSCAFASMIYVDKFIINYGSCGLYKFSNQRLVSSKWRRRFRWWRRKGGRESRNKRTPSRISHRRYQEQEPRNLLTQRVRSLLKNWRSKIKPNTCWDSVREREMRATGALTWLPRRFLGNIIGVVKKR